MSRFSGKCDLYDTMMMEGFFEEDDSELNCFEILKRKTNGTIYQEFKLELTPFNIEFEVKKRHNPNYLNIEHNIIKVPDKRCKSGFREVDKSTYTYLFKKYDNLDDINKLGYHARKEIKFDTLLDLIPYFPYTIKTMSASYDSACIVLSDRSYVDVHEEMLRQGGFDCSDSINNYRKELQNHYLYVINKYFKNEKGE